MTQLQTKDSGMITQGSVTMSQLQRLDEVKVIQNQLWSTLDQYKIAVASGDTENAAKLYAKTTELTETYSKYCV